MIVQFFSYKYAELYSYYTFIVSVKNGSSKLLYNDSATYFNNITDDECNKILKMVNRK